MSLIRIFSKNGYFLSLLVVLALVNSALYSSLLIIINNGIKAEKDFTWMETHGAWIFLCLLVVSFLSQRFFQRRLIRFTNKILCDFIVSILNKIRFATYRSFRQLGDQKVYTVMGDTKVVAELPKFFVDLFNNGVVVVCGLAYLCWTSPFAMLITLGLTLLLGLVYAIRNEAISRDVERIRDLENDFFRYLGDLLHGFREIKMSIGRNENLFSRHLRANRFSARDLEIRTASRYLDNELFGSYSWYILLGAIIFIIPLFQQIDLLQQTTFVVVILYLMMPMSFLINAISYLTRLQVARKRLDAFHEELSLVVGQENFGQPLPVDQIECITFEEVTYSYRNERLNRVFTLGPVNLVINKGESLFVVGENGSGKSTFMMLLAGLIKPDSGRILINGVPVEEENIPHFSNLFSAIFTDAHLFSELYDDFGELKTNPLWTNFSELMQLSEIVRIDDSRRLADHNLSKGQQKRLLMIYSLLEDRQVLLLDEWAAEQDPVFRAIFYKQILPFLKERGKTVIAITHDDRYFEYADRIITFHDGQLISGRPEPSSKVFANYA